MKYRKTLFVVATFFSSLALLSAGFSAFTIVNNEDEVGGEINSSNVLTINYVNSGEINQGLETFKYNEYGFEHEVIYNNKSYKYWSKTDNVTLGLYFYVNAIKSSTFDISFNVNLKQNDTSLSFIDSYYISASYYGNYNLNNLINIINNLTSNSNLNGATTANNNSLVTTFSVNNLAVTPTSNYYFAIIYTFGGFASNDYSSIKTFLDKSNIFTFSISATANELGGNN